MYRKVFAEFLLFLFVATNSGVSVEQFDPMHLKNIKELKFDATKTIVHNLTSPVKELFCVNDTESKMCVKEYELNWTICENEYGGTDLDEAKWKCDDNRLALQVTWKRVDIRCESYKNTSAVIKGSCYLNYTLKESFHDNKKSVTAVEILVIIFFSLLVVIVFIGALCSDHLSCVFGEDDIRRQSLSSSTDLINTISGRIAEEDETSMTDYSSTKNCSDSSNLFR